MTITIVVFINVQDHCLGILLEIILHIYVKFYVVMVHMLIITLELEYVFQFVQEVMILMVFRM